MPRKDDPTKPWTAAELDSLIALARQQATVPSIALILARPEWDVRRQARARGVVMVEEPTLSRLRRRPRSASTVGAAIAVLRRR